MRLLIITFLTAFANVFTVDAQQNVDSLTISRYVQKIMLLQEYLSDMSNNNENLPNRLHYASKVLSLFINNGGEYEENGIKRKGVIIELPSTEGVSRRLLKNYLNGVAHLRYKPIRITGCIIGHVNVGSMRPHPESGFIGEVTYDTKLEFSPEGFRLQDISPRKVMCIIGHSIYNIIEGRETIEVSAPLCDIYGTLISDN